METYSNCICILLKLPLQTDQMTSITSIILSRIFQFEQRVYQALKAEDEEEIKFFLDIFLHLSDTHLDNILAENRLDIINIDLELSKKSPVESKIY